MMQRCITLVVWGCIGFSSCLSSMAQIPLPTKRITVEQGLSQNSVQTLLQDKRGFLWFATSDGLNRYDGYTFTIYRHNDTDSASLPHSWIAALCETRDGMLWIGTAEGVAMLNPKTQRFTVYKHNPNNAESIGADGVLSMMEDQSGVLWIGMRQSGLCKVQRAADGSALRFIHYFHDAKNKQSISNNAVWDIHEDRRGQFWILTGQGLDLFDRINTHSVHIPEFQSSALTTMYEDRSGTMWIGTVNDGFFSFDSKERKVLHHWNKGLAERGELTSAWVKCFWEDRAGRFWIGTQEGGLQTLDRTSGRLQSFNIDGDDVYGTGSKTVMRIYEDRSGVLWFATNSGGLRTYSQFDARFSLVKHLPHNPNSLSHNDVLSITEDRLGFLWIGTYGGGLNRYDPQTEKIQCYKHQPHNPQSLAYDYIRALLEDEQGTLWIGTFGGGLCKAERNKQGVVTRWTRYYHQPDNPQSLRHNYIWALLEEKPLKDRRSANAKTRLWIGTDDGTVSNFDRATGICTHYKFLRDGKPSNAAIQTLYQDHLGRIWVGTWGNGLLRLYPNAGKAIEGARESTKTGNRPLGDKQSNNKQHDGRQFEENNVLRSTFYQERIDTGNVAMMNIVSIAEDATGALWLGSYGAGLFRWDERTQTLMRFTTNHGLPNNVVYAILTDAENNLWVSTNNGIAKLHCTQPNAPGIPSSYTVRLFNVNDGLQSNEFNRGAYCALRDGRLAMGGVGGFNLFRPSEIKNNPHPPVVVLTAFKKFNQPQSLDSSITERSSLELSYRDAFFSFEFAGIDFVNPAKHEYAYKLEGFDTDWIYAGSQRSVNYTNLDAGEYTFRVRAANGDGIWSAVGTSLKLVITPPFWETVWFRLGVGILVSMVGYGAYRRRVHAIESRNRELQTLVDERTIEIRRQMVLLDEQAKTIQEANTSIMAKNHALEETNIKLAEADSFKTRMLSIAAHDLKNPLSSIMGFAELILSEISSDERLQTMVRAISRSSEKMLDLISNLLDASALELGRMELDTEPMNFAYICINASEVYYAAAEQKQQKLYMEADNDCYIIGDAKRIAQVVDNLVSNAIKYSPFGADIRIGVRKNHAFVHFSVQDQGPGLSDEDKSKLFGLFQRLSAQPTGTESSNGVGLAIVKQIVELHGGRVWAESEYGSGSTFIVEMPLWESPSPSEVVSL